YSRRRLKLWSRRTKKDFSHPPVPGKRKDHRRRTRVVHAAADRVPEWAKKSLRDRHINSASTDLAQVVHTPRIPGLLPGRLDGSERGHYAGISMFAPLRELTTRRACCVFLI